MSSKNLRLASKRPLLTSIGFPPKPAGPRIYSIASTKPRSRRHSGELSCRHDTLAWRRGRLSCRGYIEDGGRVGSSPVAWPCVPKSSALANVELYTCGQEGMPVDSRVMAVKFSAEKSGGQRSSHRA